MNITFILRGELEILPPILPRIKYFAEKGVKVRLICSGMKSRNRAMFEGIGVELVELRAYEKFLGKRNKIMRWFGFQRACKRFLKKHVEKNTILYICSADTAICLSSILTKYEYVFQCNELYDTLPFYRKRIRKLALNAKFFIVPEYCRANIFTSWYKLKNDPIIIPNIPLLCSNETNQLITDNKARETIDKLKDKKIIIYQGHIFSGDRSLAVISEALKIINNKDFVFLLMGKDHDNSVPKLKAIYPQTYHIGFITPPNHLEITSHAYISILSYDKVSLNNIFCAPNKIFEYSAFGVPMIGNDIPGLRYCIEYNEIGKCISYSDIESIANAIRAIDSQHEEYHKKTLDFFEKNNLDSMLDSLLLKLKR